jgi:hypothetical protein
LASDEMDIAEAGIDLEPGTLTGSKAFSPPAAASIQPDQSQSR